MVHNSHKIREDIIANVKLIEKKKLEVDKRREVIATIANTYVAKKKDEAKLQVIDMKIQSKVQAFEQTISYYKSEIEKAEKKLQDDIDVIKKKMEVEIEKLQNKFETYRAYCLTGIQTTSEKRDSLTEPLEKKKEILEASMVKEEDDDKVLVRLKIELGQLVDREKELEEALSKAMEEEQKARVAERNTMMLENAEKLRMAQAEEAEKARQQYALLKDQERIAEEARWEKQKEQRKVEILREKELSEEKAMMRDARKKFTEEIYPSLSDKAVKIFNTFKESVDPEFTYKEAMKKQTVEECEEFLLRYEEMIDAVLNHIENLSDDAQMTYSSLSIWEQYRRLRKAPPAPSGPAKLYGNVITNTKKKRT